TLKVYWKAEPTNTPFYLALNPNSKIFGYPHHTRPNRINSRQKRDGPPDDKKKPARPKPSGSNAQRFLTLRGRGWQGVGRRSRSPPAGGSAPGRGAGRPRPASGPESGPASGSRSARARSGRHSPGREPPCRGCRNPPGRGSASPPSAGTI